MPNGQTVDPRTGASPGNPLVRRARARSWTDSGSPDAKCARCARGGGRQPPLPQPLHPGGRINMETVTCYKVRVRARAVVAVGAR